MADLGENVKEVEFEPFPVSAPIEQPLPEPVQIPEEVPQEVPV